MLKVSGDNLALHTINTLFKADISGKADVSFQWKALDAKKVGRAKFGETEERMLGLLKRDYGLSDGDAGELVKAVC